MKAGLVESKDYTGESIRLLDFRGQASEVPLANVWGNIPSNSSVVAYFMKLCTSGPKHKILHRHLV